MVWMLDWMPVAKMMWSIVGRVVGGTVVMDVHVFEGESQDTDSREVWVCNEILPLATCASRIFRYLGVMLPPFRACVIISKRSSTASATFIYFRAFTYLRRYPPSRTLLA